MHYCNVCNYSTSVLASLTKHYNTQKHINNITKSNITKPNITKSNITKPNIINPNNNLSKNYISMEDKIDKINKLNELNLLKKEYEYKLKIEKLKSELELKTIECSNLEQQVAKQNNQIVNLTKINKNNIHNNTDSNTNNNFSNKEITNNINIVIINIKDNVNPMIVIDSLLSNIYNTTDLNLLMKSLINQVNNVRSKIL